MNKRRVSINNTGSKFWMMIGTVTRTSNGAMGTMYEVTFDNPTEGGITSSMFFARELDTV